MEVRDTAATRLGAIVRQRCPRCLRGQVFRGRIRMHERCPVCDLRFEREQGYFLGAMYVSYALGLAVLGSLVILTWWLVGLENPWNLTPSVVIFLLFVPAIFRYSRVIWMHLDRAVDRLSGGPST